MSTKAELEQQNIEALELLKEAKDEILQLRTENEFLLDHTDRLECLIDLVREAE